MKKQVSSLVRHGSWVFTASIAALSTAGISTGACSKLEIPEVAVPDGGSGDGDGPSGGGNTGPLPDTVTISGFIKNSQGAPVSGAEITVGTEMSAATNDNGVFDVDASPNPQDVILKIEAPDHAPQVVTVPIKTGVTEYGVPVVMQRIQLISIDPDDMQADVFIGDPLTDGSGATLLFEQPMGEPATLRFVSIPPEDGPGELRFIDGEENEALQTAGILWLELVDENGDPVPMPGGTAEIDVGGVPNVQGAGDWQGFVMDPDDALWSGPNDSSSATGTTLTFALPGGGFFSASRKYTTACVRGTVSAPDAGNGCNGALIKSSEPQGVASVDSVGADGSFCIMGAQGTSATLHIGEYDVPNVAMVGEGNCGDLPSCNDIGNIEVPDGCALGASLEPPMFGVGEACTATAQCGAGGECFNGYCVGTGAMRVSLAFSLATDLDLHLLTPSGEEIFYGNASAGGGELDLDQCAEALSCDGTPHAENIVFAESPPPGTYEVWVMNYNGLEGGKFIIEVSGDVEQTFEGEIDATLQVESEHFTFVVGAAADAGAP